MITNYQPYPQEEIDFLKEYYPNHTMKETYAEFIKRFNPDYTLSQMKHRLRKHNICRNESSKWEKGHKAWNKGIKLGELRPDFYKGMTRNRTHLYGSVIKHEIGHISKTREGYLIKVDNPDKWMPYARYIYEQEHKVKLQPKDKIMHLDGDKYNCSPDNLFLVNDTILARLNKNRKITSCSELTKAEVLKIMIEQKVKEIEETKHKK